MNIYESFLIIYNIGITEWVLHKCVLWMYISIYK